MHGSRILPDGIVNRYDMGESLETSTGLALALHCPNHDARRTTRLPNGEQMHH